MNIFVCTTLKHILITLIFIKANKIEYSSKMIVLKDHQGIIEDDFNNNMGIELIFLDESEIRNGFLKDNIFKNIPVIGNNISLVNFSYTTASKYISKNIIESAKFNNDDFIYLFHDRTFLSKYYIEAKNVNIIEDGIANYYPIKVNSIIKSIYRISKGLPPFELFIGESKKVRAIYLDMSENSPDKIKEKVVSLKYIYKVLNDKFVFKLYDFFNVVKNPKVDFLFLTQGLDVAGLCSEDEKLKLYQEIFKTLKSYSNGKVYLKIHPSESVEDYLKLNFDWLVILDQKIPFELISLTHPSICAMSLFSSCKLLTTKGVKPVINLIDDENLWREFDLDKIESTSKNKMREYFA